MYAVLHHRGNVLSASVLTDRCWGGQGCRLGRRLFSNSSILAASHVYVTFYGSSVLQPRAVQIFDRRPIHTVLHRAEKVGGRKRDLDLLRGLFCAGASP